MRVKVAGSVSKHEIDPRYVEVCEPGSIDACGVVADEPCMIGAKVEGGMVTLKVNGGEPGDVVIRLTAIRKGFKGMRFSSRRKDQFEANERRLNSNYPA